MINKAELEKIRKERSENIIGPADQKGWNEKMFKKSFSKRLYFEVKILPGIRTQLPCRVASRKEGKEIEFDLAYRSLSLSEEGKRFFEAKGYRFSKGSLRKFFTKTHLKEVIKEYIQSVIDDIDLIGSAGFKNYE